MQLNQDCIRDLLLYLEANLSYENSIHINGLHLNNYSANDLIYTADKLNEANYIKCIKSPCLYEDVPVLIVTDITYSGHQFLDTIRDQSIWEDTKAKASKIASISIPILQELATSFLKAKLGLP
jgi:hypothetical protein